MAKRRRTAEQIISKLREAEVLLAKGTKMPQVSRKPRVTEQTYYRWRKEYGGVRTDQAKRLKELGPSFKTTNCLENLNSLIAHRTGKVDRWRNSEQKHRWLATPILDIEPRLRKVSGYRHLPRLRAALQSFLKGRGKTVA